MLQLVDVKFNSEALTNVQKCIETGWVSSQGSFVLEFERAFADYVGVDHAATTSSGTTALHLALTVLGVGEGDEVLVPAFTFIATANAVRHVGAIPVFCDVDENTWCIDVSDAEKRITKHTKAIIPVHINGYPCDMQRILELTLEREICVIEDACQALGTSFNSHIAGSMSHIGCFSFFANKQLTTGEGGMCLTNGDKLSHLLRMYRDHGRSQKGSYDHEVVGFNYRMTNLQAALGISQLAGLDAEVGRRRALHERMRLTLGHTQPYCSGQSPWLYHYLTDDPEAVEHLKWADIEAKPFIPPCHVQRPYRDGTKLPVAESLRGVMLPLHSGVTDERIKVMKEVLA